MGYEIHVISDGYSKIVNGEMQANCTCTLIKGKYNVIVDTMTAWDKDCIIKGLEKHRVSCDDIHYVVCTHGHSDHIGNNNLFLNAKHIVGFAVSYKNTYFVHPFDTGEPFVIDKDVTVIPTPGHTSSDVSVIVQTDDRGIIAIAGDLFEKEEDISDPSIWRYIAGSDDPEKQERNRNKLLLHADWIVPGHGPMFKVVPYMKQVAKLSNEAVVDLDYII